MASAAHDSSRSNMAPAGLDPRQLNGIISKTERAQDLLDLHEQHGHVFDRVNITTCWSRLGRVSPAERVALRSNDGSRLVALSERTRDRLRTFEPRGVATLAHALAKLAVPGDVFGLWEEVERAALGKMSEFKPQGLANMAWAWATAGRAAPVVFDAIAAAAALCVRDFKPQEVANTVWAFATAGHAAPALFGTIAAEVARRVHEFNPQNLANTAWAFATAGHAAPVLFDAIAGEGVRRMRDFNPQDQANTAWAYATAGYAAPALFDAIAAEAARGVRVFNPQGLANTAWAYATAGHAAPVLFDAIASEGARRARDFNPQDLANTAWAFATTGRPAPALLDAIAAEATRFVRDCSKKGLATTAWAFAALDCLPTASSLFDQRFARRCEALSDEFGVEDLRQLHQWRLWYAGERGCSEGLPGAALLARCEAAFRALQILPSKTQRQVAETLSSLGLSVQQEVLIEGGYSVDLLLDCGGGQLVAVEMDGPTHFTGCEPTGATLLKRRQLKHLGRKIVSMPYWEWDALNHPDVPTEHRRRVEYLSSRLALPTNGSLFASSATGVAMAGNHPGKSAELYTAAAAESAGVPSRRDPASGRSEGGGGGGERHARFERRGVSARGDRDATTWARDADGPDAWRPRNPSRSRSRSRERYQPSHRRGGGEWFGEGALPDGLPVARGEPALRYGREPSSLYGREPSDSRRGRDDRDAQCRRHFDDEQRGPSGWPGSDARPFEGGPRGQSAGRYPPQHHGPGADTYLARESTPHRFDGPRGPSPGWSRPQHPGPGARYFDDGPRGPSSEWSHPQHPGPGARYFDDGPRRSSDQSYAPQHPDRYVDDGLRGRSSERGHAPQHPDRYVADGPRGSSEQRPPPQHPDRYFDDGPRGSSEWGHADRYVADGPRGPRRYPPQHPWTGADTYPARESTPHRFDGAAPRPSARGPPSAASLSPWQQGERSTAAASGGWAEDKHVETRQVRIDNGRVLDRDLAPNQSDGPRRTQSSFEDSRERERFGGGGGRGGDGGPNRGRGDEGGEMGCSGGGR